MKEYTVKVYENRTEWWIKGKLHREDGPAVEWVNGSKFWYLNSIRLSESEFLNKTQTVEMTVEEISNALNKNIKIIKGPKT
jgi:hypothetical protein